MELKTVQALLLLVLACLFAENVESSSVRIFRPSKNIASFIKNISKFYGLDNYGIFKPNLGYFPHDNGYYEIDRVVGGEYAITGQFPFMAVVHHLLGDGVYGQCGGTIITTRWILTAGHCIAKRPRRFLVVLGIVNKNGIGYNYHTGPGISMITSQGALHPQYKTAVNDIGLLYMPQDIPFTSTIQPVSLPHRFFGERDFAGRTAIVLGWGRGEYSNSGTTRLKYGVLRTISNENCSKYWNVNEKSICTAPGLGQDACQGDSGGPLLVMENERYVQIGIVSYGDADCPSSRPGVFTRITPYLNWIQTISQKRLLSDDYHFL